MSAGTITHSQMLEKITGGSRSDEQIAKDGARRVLCQIVALRMTLDQVERNVDHVAATGTTRKRDDADWRRLARAADRLLEGMVE